MDVSITDINDVKKEMEVRASATDLFPHFEEAYKRYQPKAEIRGFRKGKAPLHMVKQLFGESIEYNALDTIANDVYKQVITERDIRPIGEPAMVDMNYKRGEEFTFKIAYEVKPNIELKEYTKIPVEKVVHKVTEQEFENEIRRLRQSNSTTEDAKTATDDEFIVTADVQQLDDTGSPLIGKKSSGARFYLASEELVPEIRDVLRGTSVGDVRKATVEREHEDHKHTDHLELTVTKVEKVLLPELNDEFVKKITKDKVGTVADFKERMQKDLESYWTDRTNRNLSDAIVSEIVKRHEFTVPDALVDRIMDSFVEEIKNQYPNKKFPPNFDESKLREQNRGYGVYQAKWFLLRDRILETEKIEVTDADLEKTAEAAAPTMGIDKERLLQFYKTSDGVKERILTDKLMKFLTENQTITERVTEETFE